jgi:uncharacterized membrane protein
MKNNLLPLIIFVALLQTLYTTFRKLYPSQNKIDSITLIIIESIIINIFLLIYIYYTNQFNLKKIFVDIKKLTNKDFLYLILSSICITCMLILLFKIIPHFNMSVFGPSISITKIILFAIVGVIIFNEKLSFQKIMAFIFMIIGIMLLHY